MGTLFRPFILISSRQTTANYLWRALPWCRSCRKEFIANSTPYTRRFYSVNQSRSSFSLVPFRNNWIHCTLRVANVANPRTVPTCISLLHTRNFASGSNTSTTTKRTVNTVRYIVATAIVVLGLSYAAVPLYRLFCQASGYGGTVTQVDPGEKLEEMEPDRERSIVVR